MAMMIEEVGVDDREVKRMFTREGDKVGEASWVGQEQEEEDEATGWKQTVRRVAPRRDPRRESSTQAIARADQPLQLYAKVDTPNNA
jgi:hypothetical protein